MNESHSTWKRRRLPEWAKPYISNFRLIFATQVWCKEKHTWKSIELPSVLYKEGQPYDGDGQGLIEIGDAHCVEAAIREITERIGSNHLVEVRRKESE